MSTCTECNRVSGLHSNACSHHPRPEINMKKYTADDIVANINARIALDKIMGGDTRKLQSLLSSICRHSAGIESLSEDTECRKATRQRIMENS